MNNRDEILQEIDDYMKTVLFGTEKITAEEELEYVERKWIEVDDSKYETDLGKFICGCVVSRYANIHDEAGMERWCENYFKCTCGNPISEFDKNYFYGSAYARCDSCDKAVKYLLKCYYEDKDKLLSKKISVVDKRVLEYFIKYKPDNIEFSLGKKEKLLQNEKSILLNQWEKYFGKTIKVPFDINREEHKTRISKFHKMGIQYIVENQEKILDSILSVLFENYPKWKRDYDISQKLMPEINKKGDLCKLIQLVKIHIMSEKVEEMPYIGYEFSCTWDPEHGMEIMMLKNEVISIE